MQNRIMGIFHKTRSIFKNAKIVRNGFRALKQTKHTPNESYMAMRRLFVNTNGRSNDIISNLIRKKKYNDVEISGILAINSTTELKSIIADIRENGFHIFEKKLQ